MDDSGYRDSKAQIMKMVQHLMERAGNSATTQNGVPVGHGILVNTEVLNRYHAYGIRKIALYLIFTSLPGRCGILKTVRHW